MRIIKNKNSYFYKKMDAIIYLNIIYIYKLKQKIYIYD